MKLYFSKNSLIKSLRRLLFLLFFTLLLTSISAQNTEGKDPKIKKGQISIKPNSRDMHVVLRDNSMKRIDHQRKHVTISKMKHIHKQKGIKKNINKSRRQEMMQRRQQIIQQRQKHLRR